MLSLEEAQEKILAAIQPLPSETIPLSDALGRFSAEEIYSSVDLPGFDNSAMDGYAVQASDTAGAAEGSKVSLRLIGKVAAGENFLGEIQSGECVRLFTGSPLPRGADAIVMQEDTRIDRDDPNKIWITDAVKPWESVRFRGEDVKRGSRILTSGVRINIGKIALLGATGVAQLRTGCRPTIGLLATGSELVEPGQPLPAGKIYESNRLSLAAMAQKAGAIPKIYPLVPDTLDETVAAMKKAFSECDAVVTSGGVSVGEFDFVKAAFEKLGGNLDFWRVAIKPGKPFLFGQLDFNERKKFLFGVPGNPVSALVTFFLLVQPALLRMQGATDCSSQKHPVILKETFSNDGDRRHFVRVKLDASSNAHSAGIQASHILSALAEADGLLEIPPQTTMAVGSHAGVLKWD